MNDKQQLTVHEPERPVLILEGDPEGQLQYAQKAAAALMKAVDANPHIVMKISGRRYLKFGAWQIISRFFGGTVVSDWSRPMERDGRSIGWEARAVVHQHGQVIAAAEAMCLRTERNWNKRDDFALRSMAQTRAGGKAMRNAFGWVAELGGYDATPAEEMTEPEPDEGEPKDQQEIDMEKAAKQGMKNLEAVWRDMDNTDRRRLQPHLAKYKELARQADETQK